MNRQSEPRDHTRSDTEERALEILVVEDEPGDALLLTEMLNRCLCDQVSHHLTTLHDTLLVLERRHFDLIFLDLNLPDAQGIATVEAVTQKTPTPIVAVTNYDIDEIAKECSERGVYPLRKSELNPRLLNWTLGWAGSLARLVKGYRRLSHEGNPLSVSRAHVGLSALSERAPDEFEACVDRYQAVLLPLPHHAGNGGKLAWLASQLGRYGAGPRDVVDMHLAAMDRLFGSRRLSVSAESRIVALELMGKLVDFYRLGRQFDARFDRIEESKA